MKPDIRPDRYPELFLVYIFFARVREGTKKVLISVDDNCAGLKTLCVSTNLKKSEPIKCITNVGHKFRDTLKITPGPALRQGRIKTGSNPHPEPLFPCPD